MNEPWPISSAAEISPDWLGALLAQKYPGTDVTSVCLGTQIGGTASKIRLMLTYNAAGHRHGLPSTLWLKAGFEPHSGSQHLQAIYTGETLFYRDVADLLDLGPPKAFAAWVAPQTAQCFLLLEDLLATHARFGHSTEPVTVEGARQVLRLLAKLHARYWDSKALNPIEWLQGGGAMGKSGVHDMTFLPEIWNRCAALPRGQYMQGPLGDREKMHAIMKRLLASDLKSARCLVHGDAQLMNLYFTPRGDAGLLDWQTAMWGSWVHDVTEFLVTGLSIADRRAHERSLVGFYVESLAELGVNSLTAEKAWADYRRHTIYTFHWMLCQPEWQPEEVCLANAERAHAAILDHRSFDLWAA